MSTDCFLFLVFCQVAMMYAVEKSHFMSGESFPSESYCYHPGHHAGRALRVFCSKISFCHFLFAAFYMHYKSTQSFIWNFTSENFWLNYITQPITVSTNHSHTHYAYSSITHSIKSFYSFLSINRTKGQLPKSNYVFKFNICSIEFYNIHLIHRSLTFNLKRKD